MSELVSRNQKMWWLLHAVFTIGLLFLFRVPIIAGPLLFMFALHTYIRWDVLSSDEQPKVSEVEQILLELDALKANINIDEIRQVLADVKNQQQRFLQAIGSGSQELRSKLRSTTIKADEREALQLHIDAVVSAEQKLEEVYARERQILHQLKAFRVYLLQLDTDDPGLDIDMRVRSLKEVLEATQKTTF